MHRGTVTAGLTKSDEGATGRKGIEETSHHAEYGSLLDYAVGTFRSTPEGKYIDVNPSFAKIVGFSTLDEMVEEITDIGSPLYF